MGLETTGGIMAKLTERLPVEQTKRLSWSLGLASVSMVALGYPGDVFVRWSWWALVMVQFCFVVFQLEVGLIRPQASKRPTRHPPCILCLLLHRGLLAYLPICVEWPFHARIVLDLSPRSPRSPALIPYPTCPRSLFRAESPCLRGCAFQCSPSAAAWTGPRRER